MIKDEDMANRFTTSPKKRREARQRRRKRKRKFFRFLIVLLLLGCLAGWFWYQQNGLSTETYTVSGAPEGFRGYRIALISDLHGMEFGEDNHRLLEFVEGLDPDLIAITGDLIHSEEQMEIVPPLAKGLAAIAPTYYVTGNHEWPTGVVPELESLLQDCGVTVLPNTYEMLTRNGDSIALLGAEDPNGLATQKTIPELMAEVKQEQGDVYTILLSHRNNLWVTYRDVGADLTLSGHAHGGQIRLPGTQGLIGPMRELLPDYTGGMYDLGTGTLVVSRGLGDQSPAFRLWNRPDVPLVVLTQ